RLAQEGGSTVDFVIRHGEWRCDSYHTLADGVHQEAQVARTRYDLRGEVFGEQQGPQETHPTLALHARRLRGQSGELLAQPLARFALERLEQHGAGLRGHGLLQLFDVAKIEKAEPGRERAETLLVLGLPGGGERAQGAAVEGVVEAEDLDPLGRTFHYMPVAGELDHRLVGLGPAVAEEGALERRARPGELLGEPDLRLGDVEVGGMPE